MAEIAHSMDNITVAAAMLAIIIGVVALLTSAEVAKRLQARVDERLTEADKKLMSMLARQEERMNSLRTTLAQKADANEAAVKEVAEQLRQTAERLSHVIDSVDELEVSARNRRLPEAKDDGGVPMPAGWPRRGA